MQGHPRRPTDAAGDFAAGFYPAFENGWRRAELAGGFVMLAFVVICALGFLGHGPFSERELANKDHSIVIRYEPVVRFGAPTILRFDTKGPPAAIRWPSRSRRTSWINSAWRASRPARRLGKSQAATSAIVFPVKAGESHALIRFTGSPAFRGSVALTARLDAGETLSWSQYAVP